MSNSNLEPNPTPLISETVQKARLRRRSQPWIHRYSRPIMAAIATLGAVITAYLAFVSFSQGAAACPTNSCDVVLSSPYAKVFGLPLSLFGCLGYLSMITFAIAPLLITSSEQKEFRTKLETWTGLLLFMGGTTMMVFSGYLIYLLVAVIQSLCIYCIASAIFSASLFVLSVIGRKWEDVGQLFFTGSIVAILTILLTLGIYANVNNPIGNSAIKIDQTTGKGIIESPTTRPKKGLGWEITTTSGSAEISLAKHLKQSGAKVYVLYTCPHCYKQKQLFGKEAVKELNLIECLPDGQNAQPKLCEAANITGVPTWEINGKFYQGERSLEELATLSSYQGDRKFLYQLAH
jgi:uncharacterized membrane protein/glutaredoxin